MRRNLQRTRKLERRMRESQLKCKLRKFNFFCVQRLISPQHHSWGVMFPMIQIIVQVANSICHLQDVEKLGRSHDKRFDGEMP